MICFNFPHLASLCGRHDRKCLSSWRKDHPHFLLCVYVYIYIYIYIQISNCQFWRKDLAFELFTVNSVYKIIVGLSWFFVLTSLFLHSSESRHTNQLCSISQCNSDSLLNEVNDFPWIWGNLLFMYLNPFYL